ncbi:PREDICTED: uncharacterized protein LOC106120163 [Papilio xuthus]|uniref:Uncharacterized protein LOC106120163 n=1 Tax=Papilio xuthus TaxID=66420 RepID=A0AAJ6ZEP0_PAPXU|nr:PREDICTED: uncharacterized protein LOC106120163 [Papilio xuthus]
MCRVYLCILLVTFASSLDGKSKKHASPPHCTQVTKDTDYANRFKLTYPVVYIIPGQREAYQQMFCINPSEVNKAVTTVCDWAAPPQVQFTLGDEYMHVVRVDPTGRYQGNAVITTYQLCSHNIPHDMANVTMAPRVVEIEY